MRKFLSHPFVAFPIILIIPLGSVLLVSWLVLNLPNEDTLQQLIYAMTIMGIITTITSYAIYRIGLLQWLSSLRWTLLVIVLFTVAIVMLNMWLLARLMFVDSHYLSITATVLLFAGLTAVSFGFFVSKTMTDRLQKLSEASDQVGEGNLETRLSINGNDEIAHVFQRFNEMAQALQTVDEEKEALEKTRRDLVAWVSHDLRTPLTSMRVMIEAMADGVITDSATQKRYLQSSLAEIEHLSHLINDLFEMAQLDVGHMELQLQTASLRDLVSDTIGSMSAKAQKKQINLSGDVAPNADIVEIAPDKIQRVLYNLVNNAITYTPAHESVTIRAHRRNDCVQVDVFNSGVYIEKDVLPVLFQTFYRGEKSRAQSSSGERGTGLGLAIARGLITAHGGKIWATSDHTTGTTFSFTLPHQSHEPSRK